MAEHQKNKKSKKLTIPEGFIYIGCLNGVWFFVKADENLKELNLGQINKRTGLPKYMCVNPKTGRNTGSGQAYEDLYYKFFRANGIDITKVDEVTNGADFIVNGTPRQLKFNRSAESLFRHLFDDKTGEYRYPDQDLVVPKELEPEVRALFEKYKDLLHGREIVINPPDTPDITKKMVDDQWHRGYASIKIDALDIINDSTAQKQIIFGLIASFCSMIAIGAVIDYRKNREKNKNKSVKKAIGESITNSVKRHWGKALIASLLTGVSVFGYLLNKRQNLRPN